MPSNASSAPYKDLKGDELVGQLRGDYGAFKQGNVDFACNDVAQSRDEVLKYRCQLMFERRLIMKVKAELEDKKRNAKKAEGVKIDKLLQRLSQTERANKEAVVNVPAPTSEFSEECFNTMSMTIHVLDFYDAEMTAWKASKSDGKRKQSPYWNKEQAADLRKRLFKYHSILAKVEEHLEILSIKDLRARISETGPGRSRKPLSLQDRLDKAKIRKGSDPKRLDSIEEEEQESLSKARRARLPLEAGSYRRAAFYFGQ